MEYLIKFNGKKILLSRADIASMYPELGPYFLAIMQGLNDFETKQMVKEYKQYTHSLSNNREREQRKLQAKISAEMPPPDEETPEPSLWYAPAGTQRGKVTHEPSSEKSKEKSTGEVESAEIFDFKSKRKIS